ncbi:hypothetical protein TRICI_005247 [Trichomonascus ciferrii]|uniref:Telomere length regulation protein conserved domain-containing protein n=1 Tax=Trichomonascus ciferrii TaxID=44093 RepID=A0A642UU84_9ASCO|nr:hypothetical protein TRICI_005247 [Trichomonascus ciferrii]
MDLQAITSELKEYPNLERANQLIKICQCQQNDIFVPHASSVGLYSVLINETLPGLEAHLKGETFDMLLDIFTSLPGLSGLVARIQALVASITVEDGRSGKEYSKNIQVYSHINLLCEFLSHLLSQSMTSTLSKVHTRLEEGVSRQKSKLYHREVIALFSGSRIFSALTSAGFILSKYEHQFSLVEVQRFSEWEPWTVGEYYTRYLIKQILQLSDTNFACECFEKALKLGFLAEVSKMVLNPGTIECAVPLYRVLRSSERRRFISEVCLKYYQTELLSRDDIIVDGSVVSAIASVVGKFVEKDEDFSMYSHLFTFGEEWAKNINVRRVIILVCASNNLNHLKTLFEHLLSRWGDSLSIKRHPLQLQESQTQMLFLSIQLLPLDFLRKISSSSLYLNAISNRLGSVSARPRLFGTLLAEHMSAASPDPNIKPLKFELKGFHDEEQAFWKNKIASISDKPTEYNANVWTVLSTPTISNFDAKGSHQISLESPINSSSKRSTSLSRKGCTENKKNAKTSAIDSDDEEDLESYPFPEDDAEDSDDDPTLSKKEKVGPPMYIKDLLEYLRVEDYEKQKLGIENAAGLIIQKAKFGQELEFYSQELASVLAGLKDTYEIDSYNEKKLEAMKSLVAACPTIVPQHLTTLLFEGDFSLQQRLALLSGITLGARELRTGKQDNVFPGKQLPPALEKAFGIEQSKEKDKASGPQKAIDSLTSELQRGLLKDTAQQAEDVLGGPKVLRVSRKLQKEREVGKPISTYNLYSKVASKNFVFPLTGQWHRSNGIRGLGTYSSILKAHFLKSLALLLHAAYPSAPDLPDMTTELLEIALSQRASTEPVVQEGILTIILVAIQIHDGEFLVAKWSRQIVELKTWLEDTWETIGDENIRSMAAGVLYQLIEVTDKYQRRLIGQLSGLENRIEDIKIQ